MRAVVQSGEEYTNIEATQKENCAPVHTWHTGAQLSGQMSFDELFLFA